MNLIKKYNYDISCAAKLSTRAKKQIKINDANNNQWLSSPPQHNITHLLEIYHNMQIIMLRECC